MLSYAITLVNITPIDLKRYRDVIVDIEVDIEYELEALKGYFDDNYFTGLK